MNDIYFISYDITSTKLRGKIEKTLKNYGFRVQYSIFQCMADAEQMARITNALKNVLEIHSRLVGDGDSIMIIGGLGVDKIGYVLGEEPNLAQYLIY